MFTENFLSSTCCYCFTIVRISNVIVCKWMSKCSSIDGLKEVSICHSFCSYYLFFFALSSLIVLSNFYCFQRKNINISVVTGIHHFSKCANHALLLWCKCYSYLIKSFRHISCGYLINNIYK